MLRKEIELGLYPQTLVKDDELIIKLTHLSNYALNSNNDTFKTYNYYLNSIQDDYMFYIDVFFNDSKYRGVYFTKYRPYYSNREGIENTNQIKNGYEINNLYWFKWEPIIFEILNQKNNELLLLSKKVIDAQIFYNDINNKLDNNFLNDWESSDIRAFLNGEFFTNALSLEDVLDSKIETINMADEKIVTIDKVFILDSKDVINTELGFNKGDSFNQFREKSPTDYAICQGAFVAINKKSSWWLRSPGSEEVGAFRVRFDGLTGGNGEGRKINSINGIVPALKVNKHFL